MIKFISIALLCVSLCACLPPAVGVGATGARMAYDRHHTYKQLSNNSINFTAHNIFLKNKQLLGEANITATSFNHDLILTGQVASIKQKRLAERLVKNIDGVRRFYNELEVMPRVSAYQAMQDSFATFTLRFKIFKDSGIDPNAFKIVTENGVMYVLGDVKKAQAKKVIERARHIHGVKRVVKIFKYYAYV